ncbi:hypothetical protein [uncultured Methylobacterium sp.]
MPRWMFAVFAFALLLAVLGIVATVLKTGPADDRTPQAAPATGSR